MEPLGWATAAVAVLFSASYVATIFLKQLQTVMRELKKVVRTARELWAEIRKPLRGESKGSDTKS
ncbi:hypothetical protein GCM10010244_85760 [Streptomyces coeruleorubidus]|nr:hypothetical protein GCM10010244_85760 [Streptomyces bellus]